MRLMLFMAALLLPTSAIAEIIYPDMIAPHIERYGEPDFCVFYPNGIPQDGEEPDVCPTELNLLSYTLGSVIVGQSPTKTGACLLTLIISNNNEESGVFFGLGWEEHPCTTVSN